VRAGRRSPPPAGALDAPYDRPLLARLHRWFDRHPLAGDQLVAAVTALLVAGELISGRLFSYDTAVAPSTEEVLVSLALVAPLAFGPRAPVAVFAIVSATCLVQLAVTEHVLVADLAPLVALYFLVAHGPGALRPVGLVVALVGGVVMSARAAFPGVLDGFVVGTAVVSAQVLLAALLADRGVSRRARLAALEVERDRQAEIGAARERARIARELHDVVAHSLAVMVAQADGGRSPRRGGTRSARCAGCSACCGRARRTPTCRASCGGSPGRACRSGSRSRARRAPCRTGCGRVCTGSPRRRSPTC
jgi:signal transduction histidine kinase